MEDCRLLYDAFNIYYEKGLEELKNDNFEASKRNVLLAAETLLKLAKVSTGELKNKRIKRSDELFELANKIDDKQKEYLASRKKIEKSSSSDNKDEGEFSSNVQVVDNEEVSLDQALNNLYALEGLDGVKQQVSDLVNQIKVFQMRENKNLNVPEMSNHMVFVGKPGTGKTTVARIIGQIFHALGILSKGHLVEVDRSDLVAGYVGQTALKTKEVLSKAMGGVLFIDEAYSLKKGDGNDFGQEAIDTLNKKMEDSRADLVVICAGYEDEMKPFIDSNKGLKSRFRRYIKFDDYSGKELYNIFLNLLEKNQYTLDEEANKAVYAYLSNPKVNKFTSNARDVRNLFEDTVNLQARRVADNTTLSRLELATIIKDDLPFKLSSKEDNNGIPTKLTNDDKLDVIDNKHEDNLDLKVDDILGVKEVIDESDIEVLSPEKGVLKDSKNSSNSKEFKFDWDSLPSVTFDDIAGLDYAKETVKTKVILPLEHPEAFDGYVKKNGGGLFLYGPPGTGKTMIAAAIANEIGAKFCSVKPSDLLHQGAGNSEKAVRALFAQAREFPCSVIYFDEMDAIAQKSTRSSYARQLRSELLSQIQGIESYGKDDGHLLFLIAATNKPWDVDSAFVRPGRFGTKVYVGLPDDNARAYMINSRFNKIRELGVVEITSDVNVDDIVSKTNGFNGSDITNLLDRIDEISAIRGIATQVKFISSDDVNRALEEIHSSVQVDDIENIQEWRDHNNC